MCAYIPNIILTALHLEIYGRCVERKVPKVRHNWKYHLYTVKEQIFEGVLCQSGLSYLGRRD